MLQKIIVILFTVTILSCITGCGNKSQLKGLVPVEGVVYYDGAPLEGAAVKFFPSDASGRTATAMTDANGKFVLMTLNPKDGVAPGEYKVTVVKYGTVLPAVEDDPGLHPEENARQKAIRLREAAKSKDAIKAITPSKYASPANSGLTASIGPTGDKNLEFKLSK